MKAPSFFAAAVLAGGVLSSTFAWAQLPPPNDLGVRLGHIHLAVKDVEAQKQFWTTVMGGTLVENGPLSMVQFPGVFIMLRPNAKAPVPPFVGVQPVAGQGATLLFALGLFGASMLAAGVLPLATSYSVTEALGFESDIPATLLFVQTAQKQIHLGVQGTVWMINLLLA